MNKKIYLAGPISGLTYDGAQDWREHFRKSIDKRIDCYSPLRGKEFLRNEGELEGSYQYHPLSTDQAITGRDRNDCTRADLVVFNLLGAQRITIGTMIELGWADAFRVPAILVIEDSGNPHEHPMVRQTAQFRVNNLDDARKLAEAILLPSPDSKSTFEEIYPIYERGLDESRKEGKLIPFPNGSSDVTETPEEPTIA